MNHLIKSGATASIAILLLISSNSFAFTSSINSRESNSKEPEYLQNIVINRKYIIAQVSGEISISEIRNFTKLIFNSYLNIEMNGTVINSTISNPFCIWPPISWIPGLRMIVLPENSSIHLSIKWFKGKLYTSNNGASYCLNGMGLFIRATATLKLK